MGHHLAKRPKLGGHWFRGVYLEREASASDEFEIFDLRKLATSGGIDKVYNLAADGRNLLD